VCDGSQSCIEGRLTFYYLQTNAELVWIEKGESANSSSTRASVRRDELAEVCFVSSVRLFADGVSIRFEMCAPRAPTRRDRLYFMLLSSGRLFRGFSEFQSTESSKQYFWEMVFDYLWK
jgi:hypothetical protein